MKRNPRTKTQSMNGVAAWFLNKLEQQGFTVILLVSLAWYFQMKNEYLEQRITTCNSEVIKVYKEQNEKLILVISQNTEALREMKETLIFHDMKVKDGN